jgi:hypothetical protein
METYFMLEEEFGAEKNVEKTVGIKECLGFFLVICGVSIALWVFMSVYGLFTKPEKLVPFQKLVSSNLETIISHAEKKDMKIVIPSEILSYFVPLILLMISVSVAGVLVTGGIRLLDSDVQRLSRRIATMGSKLTTKIGRIQDTLRKNR